MNAFIIGSVVALLVIISIYVSEIRGRKSSDPYTSENLKTLRELFDAQFNYYAQLVPRDRYEKAVRDYAKTRILLIVYQLVSAVLVVLLTVILSMYAGIR